MNPSMAIDGPKSFERGTHDQHFEMRFRSRRNTVLMALVFHHQMHSFDSLAELLCNSFLAIHRASLPRLSFVVERLGIIRIRTAVSFVLRAIQPRP